jgi:hypothetical protein
VSYPFLATGNGQELAVKGGIPVPVEACILKGLVEGGTVTVAFGIGKRTVDVEE